MTVNERFPTWRCHSGEVIFRTNMVKIIYKLLHWIGDLNYTRLSRKVNPSRKTVLGMNCMVSNNFI